MSDLLLTVRDLHVHFFAREGVYRALNGVDLELRRGELLGLVGETGLGKSLTLRTILNLVPPPGRVVRGHVQYRGESLLAKGDDEMRRIRGKEIALVVQNARGALNPFLSVGDQIANVYRAHFHGARQAAWTRVLEVLQAVRLPDSERRSRSYPHELSGGMAQRALIAMALVCSPEILLADEPTTGLDVTIQAQILSLLRDLVKEQGISAIVVTHDLGVVARYCDRIAVMFAGQVVELGTVGVLLEQPRHPYTISLLDSVGRSPRLSVTWPPRRPPNLLKLVRGCCFQERCPWAELVCGAEEPADQPVGDRHTAKCHLASEIYAAAH
jgi:peptide/nickel transport system ATP-binding protein